MTKQPPFILVPLLVLAGLACDSSIESALPTAWSADLAATESGSAGPVGTLSAVSQGIHIEAAIDLSRAEPGISYEWRIRSGSCAQPEDTVGGVASYPVLDASGSGSASAQALLNETLDPGGGYHAVVFEAATMQTVSCGSLERIS